MTQWMAVIFGLLLSLRSLGLLAYTLDDEYWPQGDVPYYTNLADLSGNGASDDEIGATTIGADTWGNEGDANVAYVNNGTNSDTNSTGPSTDESGQYVVTLNTVMSYNGTGRCTISANGSQRLGYSSYWSTSEGKIVDGYVVVCQGLTDESTGAIIPVSWYTGTGSPSGSQYDFTSVAAHELGHLLAFEHSCDDVVDNGIPDCQGPCGTGTDPLLLATMCYSLALGDVFMRDIAADDIAGLQAKYGVWDADGDGYSLEDGDCNDADSTVYPGASETDVDGKDNDCDGKTDEAADADQDGYSPDDGDCNDNNDTIYPDATEIEGDGIDNDCDGRIDESGPSCSTEPAVNAAVEGIVNSPLISATLRQDLLALYYRNATRVGAVWSEVAQGTGLDLLARWEAVFMKGPNTRIAPLLAETATWLKGVSVAVPDRDVASLAQFFSGQSKRKNLTLADFIPALERFFEKNQKGEGLYLGGHQLL